MKKFVPICYLCLFISSITVFGESQTTRDSRPSPSRAELLAEVLEEYNALLQRLPYVAGEYFSDIAFRFNTESDIFRCNRVQVENTRRNASKKALDKCKDAGCRDCQVHSKFLVENGELGFIDGRYYGRGCYSKATVRAYDCD